MSSGFRGCFDDYCHSPEDGRHLEAFRRCFGRLYEDQPKEVKDKDWDNYCLGHLNEMDLEDQDGLIDLSNGERWTLDKI